MIKIDMLIFGYHIVELPIEKLNIFATKLLQSGVNCQITGDGKVYIKHKDIASALDILKDYEVYKISNICGLYGVYKNFSYKKGVAIGLFIAATICVISSLLVWDIRIDGNEKITDSSIIYELSKCGLDEGNFWFKCDKNDIEAQIKLTYPSVAWININRRGTVAYITVNENKENNEFTEIKESQFSNIVADCDCIIEEIAVRSGCAVVSPGDVVKKGDVLVLGVINTNGIERFCNADGTVMGRINDTVRVSISKNDIGRKVISKEILSVRVEMFNFPINILKRYRNLTEEYDIIDDVKVLSLFNNKDLPIKIITSYVIRYDNFDVTRNDEEIVRLASARLSVEVVKRLVGADLVKIRTYGDYTDNGYEMYSQLVYTANIGSVNHFTVEE